MYASILSRTVSAVSSADANPTKISGTRGSDSGGCRIVNLTSGVVLVRSVNRDVAAPSKATLLADWMFEISPGKFMDDNGPNQDYYAIPRTGSGNITFEDLEGVPGASGIGSGGGGGGSSDSITEYGTIDSVTLTTSSAIPTLTAYSGRDGIVWTNGTAGNLYVAIGTAPIIATAKWLLKVPAMTSRAMKCAEGQVPHVIGDFAGQVWATPYKG